MKEFNELFKKTIEKLNSLDFDTLDVEKRKLINDYCDTVLHLKDSMLREKK